LSELPPNSGSDDVDDQYRRASALGASRPSERVRRAILAHAAQLAEERAALRRVAAPREVAAPMAANDDIPAKLAVPRHAANQSWRRPAIFGTLAAAGLAGLLIAPRFLPNRAPSTAALSENEAARPGADAVTAPKSPPPPLAAVPSPAPAPPPALLAQLAPQELAAKKSSAQESQAQDKSTNGARASNGQNMFEARRQREAQRQSEVRQDAPGFVPDPGATSAITSRADLAAASAQAASPRTEALSRAAMSPSAAYLAAGRLDEPAAALRRAAEAGDVGVIQGLLDQHAVIDGRDASGRTALLLATLHGRLAAVEALLKGGADPNAADSGGMTPLQAAVAGDQPQIEAALRRAGAR
jgi:hypothetical protein